MTTSESNLTIDGDRLWQSLMDMAEIGATPKGGVNRLTLTDLDRKARDLLIAWGEAEGLTTTVDKIGNIFMRREGSDPTLPPIVSGSHIDTQPTGGKYDGAFGVLAALEVVRTLNERGIKTKAPIEVVSWTNEEGSRFVPVMMGSGVFCGSVPLEVAYGAADTEGKTVGGELERIGYLGDQTPGDHPIGAYFEAHIEQGPVLEDSQKVIGVVPAVLGLTWYDCEVIGMEAHAGPTPMPSRKDALLVATRIMQEVIAIAERHQPHGRGTVGMVQLHPNSRNVIPGQVKFSIDLRHAEGDVLQQMHEAITAFVDDERKQTGFDINLERVSYYPPRPFHDDCIESIRKAAERFGYPTMEVISGAGHDAIYVAGLAPAGMIFVPCKDGISHNELESAEPADLTAGANVLLHAVLDRAGTV